MVARTLHPSRRCIFLGLASLLLPLGDAAALEARTDPFAGMRPLSAHELARLRGGFITVGGWEIAFSVTVDINIDDTLKIRTWLTPLANLGASGSGGSGATPPQQPAASLNQAPAPAQQSAAPTQQAASPSQQTAAASQQANGSSTSGVTIEGGGMPVQVSLSDTGLSQRVGTPDTTMVETIVTPDRISQIVANTRNHANVSALTTVSFDMLNHSQRVGNGTGLTNRSLVHLIGSFGHGIGAFRR